MHKARLRPRPLRCGRLAELSCCESGDTSTEFLRFFRVFGLGQHPDDRFRAGGADEYAAGAVEVGVDTLDLGPERVRHLLRDNSHILFRLWVARQQGGGLGKGAFLERAAEE